MKKYILKYVLGAWMLATLFACDDYFDVRPKSQVPANALFGTEQGFEDVLTGVYKQMSSTALYGQEMTFGLVEVLSQNYDLAPASSYIEAARYNYENPAIESKIDAIWKGMYEAIANLNLLLANIDNNPSLFSTDTYGLDNYRIFKAEALGLRAFLHFELLRLFAPAYTANPQASAIPYVTEYAITVTPQSTVAEVVERVIRDLKEAESLLEGDVHAGDIDFGKGFRFNKNAIAATLARAYQWKGTPEDMELASEQARKVIAAFPYQLGLGTDYLSSEELVFRLYVTEMDKIINPYFRNGSGTERLSPSQEHWNDIYENTNSDKRCNFSERVGEILYLSKYWQDRNGASDQIPLIRLSEMYYIAAEAAVDSVEIKTTWVETDIWNEEYQYYEWAEVTLEVSKSLDYLGKVRNARSVYADLAARNLNAEACHREIYKEYRKEMIGEGQLFYYYKRRGYANIPGSAATAANVYVLPMPDNEIEFGGRK